MPTVKNTPAPYPSTILSLLPAEQFLYRDARIQAITVSPLPQDHAAPYILSGIVPNTTHLRTYQTPALPASAPAIVQAVAAAELRRYAVPAPPAPGPAQTTAQVLQFRPRTVTAPPQRQHLADPSGPEAVPGTVRPPRTSSTLQAQPQHLAAPAPAPRKGKHRA